MESYVARIYPHLTDKLVQKIASNFGLGKLRVWSGVAGGWSNVNIKLETTTGVYIVRFYRYGARSYEDINLEFTILDKLKSSGLPVAPAIADRNSQRIVIVKLASKKIYYAVFEYVGGDQITILNSKQYQILGQSLAQVHQSLSDFKSIHVRKYWHFESEINRIKRKLIKRANTRSWQFESQISLKKFNLLIKQESDNFLKVAKKQKTVLRSASIIHGDFHAANVKFLKNKIVGIFDFDSTIHGPIILDLAICIANLALQNTEQGRKTSLAIILKNVTSGYQKQIKLDKNQKQILPPLIRFWLFSQFSWTLKLPQSPGQQFFYEQVFGRVLTVLKAKSVSVR